MRRKENRQSFVTTQRGRTCLKFLNLAGIESLFWENVLEVQKSVNILAILKAGMKASNT